MSRTRYKFRVYPSMIETFLDVLQDGQSAILTYSAEGDNYVVELREGASDETVIQTVGVESIKNGQVSSPSKWTTLEETYLERIRSLQDKIAAKDEEIRLLKLSAETAAGQSDSQKEEDTIKYWQAKLGEAADSLNAARRVVLNLSASLTSNPFLAKNIERA